MTSSDLINVHIVYGDSHIPHLERVLLPSLASSTTRQVRVHCTNYNGSSNNKVHSGERYGVRVLDVPNPAAGAQGFAANHNLLFRASRPDDCFIMLNPDCIAVEGTIDALLRRYQSGERVGIVEGRQWPFEHPKEYDPLTLETPWASGAFCLVDSSFYQHVGGMDERYFLYNEDVDLSWQAWLNDWRVIYEPDAPIVHFSGGPFLRPDILNREEEYCLRNHIVLASKFFGADGEAKAIEQVRRSGRLGVAKRAVEQYERTRGADGHQRSIPDHPKVNIYGVNVYHKMRDAQ